MRDILRTPILKNICKLLLPTKYQLIISFITVYEKKQNYIYFQPIFSFHTCWTERKKCLYSELFWSLFSRIRTEYGKVQSISQYSVQMRENKDQNNSEYGYFSRIAVEIIENWDFLFSWCIENGTLTWNVLKTHFKNGAILSFIFTNILSLYPSWLGIA